MIMKWGRHIISPIGFAEVIQPPLFLSYVDYEEQEKILKKHKQTNKTFPRVVVCGQGQPALNRKWAVGVPNFGPRHCKGLLVWCHKWKQKFGGQGFELHFSLLWEKTTQKFWFSTDSPIEPNDEKNRMQKPTRYPLVLPGFASTQMCPSRSNLMNQANKTLRQGAPHGQQRALY